jgi:hypothetical protein
MIPVLGDLIESTVGKVVDGGMDIIKRLIPDKAAQAAAEIEMRKLALDITRENEGRAHEEIMGQLDINKTEAASSDAFVRRARPAIMWICAAAFGYTFIAYPFLQWGFAIWKPGIVPPVLPNTDQLYVVLYTLLGFGGYRTFEKMKGVSGK